MFPRCLQPPLCLALLPVDSVKWNHFTPVFPFNTLHATRYTPPPAQRHVTCEPRSRWAAGWQDQFPGVNDGELGHFSRQRQDGAVHTAPYANTCEGNLWRRSKNERRCAAFENLTLGLQMPFLGVTVWSENGFPLESGCLGMSTHIRVHSALQQHRFSRLRGSCLNLCQAARLFLPALKLYV